MVAAVAVSETFEPSNSLIVGRSRVLPGPAPMCAIFKWQDPRLRQCSGVSPS